MNLLQQLRDGNPLNLKQQMQLIWQLSIPGILAQVSTIVMEYIDASMVGHLGAKEAASVGLVASSTWLLGCLCYAASMGFTVQIAHAIGAKRDIRARNLVKVGLLFGILFSSLIMSFGLFMHNKIPILLGADPSIHKDASIYFFIIALSLPAMQLNGMAAGMLQCSGNMKVPSVLQVLSCFLDIFFNFFLIFETRTVNILGISITFPGAGLGVMGAALGTAVVEVIIMSLMLYFLLFRSQSLSLRHREKMHFSIKQLKEAFRISWPVGLEQLVMCSAYVMFTAIVSPLGMAAIAANSFAITIESLCYMPGYGIGSAATTLIGQSIGARRKDLTQKLAHLTTAVGMAIMTFTAILMYIFAPQLIGFFTLDPEIRRLGTLILRIEAFAEPFYAASIVANGVFRGAGSTFVPSIMNLISMWVVRLPLAFLLAKEYGLKGAWIAMCVELIFRGSIYLVRLFGKGWFPKNFLTLNEGHLPQEKA
ncbi:MAG: MATE family efflux transporter [Fibrobacteraceae bacterium]|nr:MATE family efflux transporter [Fibrobacteraceae bacterium]